MLRPRRRRRFPVASGLLPVLAFGALLGGDILEHTDDGCPVETHCIPCQLHYGTTAVPTSAADPASPPRDLGTPVAEAGRPKSLEAAPIEAPSRAPPLD